LVFLIVREYDGVLVDLEQDQYEPIISREVDLTYQYLIEGTKNNANRKNSDNIGSATEYRITIGYATDPKQINGNFFVLLVELVAETRIQPSKAPRSRVACLFSCPSC
jgi:hypothetical protein